MLDIGGRVTNESDVGVTGGIHRRIFSGDVMLGLGLFYDWQEEFHQGSVAFELFTNRWALRSNGYAIIGDDVEGDSEYATTGATIIGFEDYNIVARNLLLEEEYEVAMSGADVELARSLGFRSAEVFVGGYFYGGDIGDDTVGAKGGVRGFLMPDLAASFSVADDDLFGTSAYGGITWFLGARGGLSRPNISRRLLIPVERNEQIVTNDVEESTPVAGPVVLTFEDDAIEIVHVDSTAAAGGDGTFATPFDTLPDTQEADIVYVHSGTTYTGQYTLAEDQRFLGEGDSNFHFVETEELGEILLPAANGNLARPVINRTGFVGDAITLVAQDDEVSNFRILNVTGNAIFGDGVTDFDVNRNIIAGTLVDPAADPVLDPPTGRGILLQNVSGAVDEELVATGEITGNEVTGSEGPNIELILTGDFEGEISGNIADGSTTAEGIFIHQPLVAPLVDVAFVGEVSDNTATGNFTDGIGMEVDSFSGEISDNIANGNTNAGFALTFGVFDGDIEGNTASGNGDVGIDFHIDGDGFSEIELAGNTADNNGAEGMHLIFSGTGTANVEVLNNTFFANNPATGRDFFAENEDLPGFEPTTYIELEGNSAISVTALGSFNYEFDNNDLFADGEMFLELGTNVGTVEDDEDVEPGEFPW
jgi:hypothetical protein